MKPWLKHDTHGKHGQSTWIPMVPNMASMVKLQGWQTWNSMCGKHGLANWAGQFFHISQHHPVVRMSLWARYKAPRWVLDIFNPVRSISSSPWTLSRMENGIWSSESKVNPQILIRAGLTTDGGKGSSSPTGMSVVGCHPPNKSRTAFFLPALRLASFDFPGCHHWTIPESPSTSTTWPMTKGSAFESFKVMTKSPTQHEASMAGSESPTVPSCTKLSRGIPGMSAPSKGWESSFQTWNPSIPIHMYLEQTRRQTKLYNSMACIGSGMTNMQHVAYITRSFWNRHGKHGKKRWKSMACTGQPIPHHNHSIPSLWDRHGRHGNSMCGTQGPGQLRRSMSSGTIAEDSKRHPRGAPPCMMSPNILSTGIVKSVSNWVTCFSQAMPARTWSSKRFIEPSWISSLDKKSLNFAFASSVNLCFTWGGLACATVAMFSGATTSRGRLHSSSLIYCFQRTKTPPVVRKISRSWTFLRWWMSNPSKVFKASKSREACRWSHSIL